MKTFPTNRVARLLVSVAGLLVLTTGFAEDSSRTDRTEPHFDSKVPWAIGFWMEGSVTNVAFIDERIQFQLNGRFWLAQYPPGATKQQVIEVHCEKGFLASVTPGSFVAMTSDWRAGSVVNEKAKLLKIIEAAADHGTVVKFSLLNPKMDFGTNGFTLLDAKVWRITDANLR